MNDEVSSAYSKWINEQFETPNLTEAFQAGWDAAWEAVMDDKAIGESPKPPKNEDYGKEYGC